MRKQKIKKKEKKMKFRVQSTVVWLFIMGFLAAGGIHAQSGPPAEAIQSVSPPLAVQGDMNVVVRVNLLYRYAPPYRFAPLSFKIGALEGRELARNGLTVMAIFDIPGTETPGTKSISLEFPGPGGQNVVFSKAAAFEIRASSQQTPDPDPGPAPPASSYTVVDTGQVICYDNFYAIACPQAGEAFYGQDAQYRINPPAYRDNGDGTVTDLNTGLMWQKTPADEKMTWDDAMAGASSFELAGYTDWRLPTIKELYSLIVFSGTDPSAQSGVGDQENIPFIDTNYFDFQYGDTSAGERIIDAQYWSSTEYGSTTMGGNPTVFGVNFADGRIKGYPRQVAFTGKSMSQFVRYVRGNAYGSNDFIDNNDGTISDRATGLMWSQSDSGRGMNWQEALSWVVRKNNENYLGYSDWRLPNAKELQSIVDYTRAPDTTNSPAIDPVFQCTAITNEGGVTDYPYYWTGTTHASSGNQYPGSMAVYIAFGEALGYMDIPPNSGIFNLQDVHGAGAQRCEPKSGSPDDWPHGNGPQGDVIRIYNFVRLVRGNL